MLMMLKTIIYTIFLCFYPLIVLGNNIEGKGLICSKYKSSLKYDESQYIGYWFTKNNITKYSIEGYEIIKIYKQRYKTLTRFIEWQHESCPDSICILNRETLKISDYQCVVIKTKLGVINKLESYIEEQKIKNKI